LACKTTKAGQLAADTTKISNSIEAAMWRPCKTKLEGIKGITTAEEKLFFAAASKFSAKLGMGDVGCAAGKACTARTPLKGSLAVQELAMNAAVDYYVAQRAHCKIVDVAATITKCNADGLTALEGVGTAMAAADYYSKKTVAERATWMTAEMKKNVAAALAALVPAAGAVGASCKAAAAVAPATVGVRPTCGANCCMGFRKAETDTVNSAETCQLKTTTKA
jgi:hypothetical protein